MGDAGAFLDEFFDLVVSDQQFIPAHTAFVAIAQNAMTKVACNTLSGTESIVSSRSFYRFNAIAQCVALACRPAKQR